jgi:hypothetical protein
MHFATETAPLFGGPQQFDWEWSKDPEIARQQFEAALAAKGLHRPQTKKKGPSRPCCASPQRKSTTRVS